MVAKVIWKMALFSLSIFVLLLTMGYGQGDYTPTENWALFSGQAKVAQPGARTGSFKSVTPAPAPDKTIWDTIRDTTDKWMGGGNMMSTGQRAGDKSELEKLQSRNRSVSTMSTQGLY